MTPEEARAWSRPLRRPGDDGKTPEERSLRAQLERSQDFRLELERMYEAASRERKQARDEVVAIRTLKEAVEQQYAELRPRILAAEQALALAVKRCGELERQLAAWQTFEAERERPDRAIRLRKEEI